MAYTQSFYGLDGTQYTVNIDNVSPATPPPLAAQPFESQENDDSDLFIPVRTQSGYLRILLTENAHNWKQFVPTGAVAMPVKLMKNPAGEPTGTVIWQGYVQTGTYGMTYPSVYEEFDLPLICPLSALDAFTIDATGPAEIVTVGNLIAHLLNKLSGLTFNVYFSSNDAGTPAQWLNIRLLWRNFVDISNGVRKGRMSCLSILEELCKFFGWSCRTFGDGVYFTSIFDSTRNTKYIMYSVSDLANNVGTSTSVALNTLAVTDQFATTDLSEEIIPGIKSVTVNSELNAYDVLVEPPYNDLQKKYKYNTITEGERWIDAPVPYTPYILYRGSGNYEDENVTIETYAEATDPNNPMCYGRLIIYDPNMDEPKLTYNWTVAFECFRSEDYGERQQSDPLFKMTSKDSFIMSDGVLYLDGGSDSSTANSLAATCRLKVGTYYWDGVIWTETESTFTLYCGRNGIEDTRTSIEADYNGTGIPVVGHLVGTISFEVLDVQPGGHGIIYYNGYLPIIRFKIGFVRSNEDSELNSTKYSHAGGQFMDVISVDTIFSSDKQVTSNNRTMHCQAGYGLVLNQDGSVVNTIPYEPNNTNNAKPEDHNAGVIAGYGQSIRRTAILPLKTSVIGTDIGPKTKVSFDGNTFAAVAVSYRPWDNITILKLMQI